MEAKEFVEALTGANKKMVDRILYWILGFYIALSCVEWAMNDRDSTDSPTERSNMMLHTDHMTGCQYLSSRGGGLTPRLDSSGNHQGCNTQ